MQRWYIFNFLAGFGVYWLSNLLLWYPWSYSAELGMTLMLSVSPLIWAYTSYLCLITYPAQSVWRSALFNALILLLIALVMDYVFFGLIRNAMEDLYHPTTLYGYAFLITLPFLIVLIFKRRIENRKRFAEGKDFLLAGLTGLLCILALIVIIAFNLNL